MKWYFYAMIALGAIVIIYVVYAVTKTKTTTTTVPYTPTPVVQSKPTLLQWVQGLAPILIGAAAIGSQTGWFGTSDGSGGKRVACP